MRKLLVASILACVLVQVGCTKGRETTTEAAREPKMSDSDLKNKVESQFQSDPELRDISVSADVDRNWVTLSGTVPTENVRTKAVEMARSAQPGVTVEDKIDVKPPETARADYTPEMARTEVDRAKTRHETVGSSIDDAWIHSKIVAKLIGDKDVSERHINVDVDHNVVTLRGTVDSMAEKQEAERIAQETDGVKRVNNMLKVGKS